MWRAILKRPAIVAVLAMWALIGLVATCRMSDGNIKTDRSVEHGQPSESGPLRP